ncbi:MAG: hypothetical protein E5V89_23615 [Mesorhizobium sp.]|uniref:hypothetical protein n=1 Tax=Mesorhizobium sp. TaxID=1871066 RepID=UPI000FEA09F9|nr:hypothetical protein [Mesorhizobium sp.]RWD43871.1 MAG: hypothetical protein EOS36_32555 [Mesorhizobium sp.]RWE45110.1 MAG: hypothetical protein EOS79_13550 [Mesorhizobium sp.]TIV67750.1 MAG: hypothetical protein E5V89_23615 [Mesorhizobium sp.]
MRKFFTSLFAFILSGLAGGLVAQQLAVITGATDEYILVFMLVVLTTVIVTILFFVAQLMTEPLAAVGKVGKWTLIAFTVLLVALVAVIAFWEESPAAAKEDMPIVAGLGLPSLVTIIVQWLFVRWRLKRTAAGFGRGGANA